MDHKFLNSNRNWNLLENKNTFPGMMDHKFFIILNKNLFYVISLKRTDFLLLFVTKKNKILSAAKSLTMAICTSKKYLLRNELSCRWTETTTDFIELNRMTKRSEIKFNRRPVFIFAQF